MARYTGPKCRYCRAEKTKLFLKGERCHTGKCPMNDTKSTGLPGKDPRARSKKPTDYGLQLREKQKLKRTYCMLEKQFKLAFDEAARIPGKTGENLIMLLERRLDNVVFRLGLALSRSAARQLVRHRHFSVNGRTVDIPSFQVRVGDEIAVRDKSKELLVIKSSLESRKGQGVPDWMEMNSDRLVGRILHIPTRASIGVPINEQLIVELYSK